MTDTKEHYKSTVVELSNRLIQATKAIKTLYYTLKNGKPDDVSDEEWLLIADEYDCLQDLIEILKKLIEINMLKVGDNFVSDSEIDTDVQLGLPQDKLV